MTAIILDKTRIDKIKHALFRSVNVFRCSGCSQEDSVACVSMAFFAKVSGAASIEDAFAQSLWDDVRLELMPYFAYKAMSDVWHLLANSCENITFGYEAGICELYESFIESEEQNQRLTQTVSTELIEHMLDCARIARNERVCNLACSSGRVIRILASRSGCTNIYACEHKLSAFVVARIGLILRGVDPYRIVYGTGLRDAEVIRQRGFDVAIVLPPFGDRINASLIDVDIAKTGIPYSLLKSWQASYLLRALAILREGGRLVAFVREELFSGLLGDDLKSLITAGADIELLLAQPPFVGVLLYRHDHTCEKIGDRKIVARCAAVDRASIYRHLKGVDLFSNSKEAKEVVIPALGSWSPRKLLADDMLRKWSSDALIRFGDVFESRDMFEGGRALRYANCLSINADGASQGSCLERRSSNSVLGEQRVSLSGSFVLTPSFYSLRGGFVDEALGGSVLSSQMQMYMPTESEFDLSVRMEMLCRTLAYRRYLRMRYMSGNWRYDILDYLIPRRILTCPAELVDNYRRFKKELSEYKDRLNHLAAYVSRIMVDALQIRQTGALHNEFWSEIYPTVKITDLIVREARYNRRGILPGIEVDSSRIMPLFMAAYMICDFLPEFVRFTPDSSVRSLSLIFTLKRLSIPLPSLQEQSRVVAMIKDVLHEYEVVLERYRVGRGSKREIDEFERAVFS